MSQLRELLNHAENAVVVQSTTGSIDAESLRRRVRELAALLHDHACHCVALYADNSIDWVVADLACLEANIRIVPLPLFFSPSQVRHALESSGADFLLSDRSIRSLGLQAELVAGWPQLPTMHRFELQARRDARIPAGTRKITYTSGTTGQPRGVCLSANHLRTVAASLQHATGLQAPRHLCVMPLSTLLENVAGVYAPLLAGGSVIVPPLAEVGLSGSSGLDLERLLSAVTLHRPDSLILVPEILRAVVTAAERGWRPPTSLRFVAVGGSKVAPTLIDRSWQVGLPVYEGYGLSECGSVVALNAPGQMRAGSTGRPLPHVSVSAVDGEIVVAGNSMLGYVNQPETWGRSEIRTGDRGHIDAEGYVYVDGRTSSLVITGFGRNLSPEWVESELLAGSMLMQAIVFGDARPWCSALVWPSDAGVSDRAIGAWIHEVNKRLPDYARIVNWQRLPEPLAADTGLLTNNGRPRRTVIEQNYRSLIDGLYEQLPEAINQ